MSLSVLSEKEPFLYIRKLRDFNLKFMLSSKGGYTLPYLIIDLIKDDNLYLISDGFDHLGDQFMTGYIDSIIIYPWPQCTSIEEGKKIVEESLAIFKEIEKLFIDEFSHETI